MNLIIMPYLDCPEYTRAAVEDCLNQSLASQLLLIDNGSQDPGRRLGEEVACDPRVWRWRHDPPLPSLSATWNTALRCAWEAGCTEALVINNDVRLWQGTYEYLRATQQMTDALFVTATGVTAPQFEEFCGGTPHAYPVRPPAYPLPGPDFSCFLITRACHEKYQFDEHYVPCYVEDVCYHREMMLGGDGARIFGTGLPFLHYGSGTLNGIQGEKRERKQRQIEQGSRQHHLQKWGGPANEERFTIPFDASSARDGVATQELFARVRNGQPAV
jgi:hypothetical protein